MSQLEKVGNNIAYLRKSKGLTGERMAEILGVSPQAISKWETGKCLPETRILPLLAQTLDCSIDSILIPKELQILSANYGDGIISYDVTRLLNGFVNDNKLNLVINKQILGYDFEGDRIRILTVKYETPKGTFFTYVLDNNTLSLDTSVEGYVNESKHKILDAFYGNEDTYTRVMNKLEHYKYFRHNKIHVNHETFPSSINCDDTEYLTIIYVNSDGIHTVSCAEGETLYYNSGRTGLYVGSSSRESHILSDIMELNWGQGMDCTWAGALYAALKYMGSTASYEYIMGVSGACFRIAFTPIWDYSSVDALVAYDYAKIGYEALGYELIWADRIDKDQRKTERQNIMEDIKAGKPPIAINLRIAPEWGVITGYLDNGDQLLCRTYFDKAIFDANKDNAEFIRQMEQTKGYPNVDCWPFAIAHFGKEVEKPSEKQILLNSLQTKIESMSMTENRGYKMGYEAYKAWIEELLNHQLFEGSNPQDTERRLQVNDYLLQNLLDARRCAAQYLKNSVKFLNGDSTHLLIQMATLYQQIYEELDSFSSKLQQQADHTLGYMEQHLIESKSASSRILRREQADMLDRILEMEKQTDMMAKRILELEAQ